MNIHSVGAKLYAEARTDKLTNLIAAFINFAEEIRNGFPRYRTGGSGMNIAQANEKWLAILHAVMNYRFP
jgi:hypothetical protein